MSGARSRKLGLLTIGQAPRTDMQAVLDAHIPSGTECLHRGLLDGLTLAQIEQGFGAEPGEALLTSRLRDAQSVQMSARKVHAALPGVITDLEDAGCDVVLLLCTGAFSALSTHKAWLVLPDQIIPPAVTGLAGQRQVGLIVPLPEQIASEQHKWRALAKAPIAQSATPYLPDGPQRVREAAQALSEQGAQLLVLDCMGYQEAHRQAAIEGSKGLPVLLSNALMSKLTAELL